MKDAKFELEVDGERVVISEPQKIIFPSLRKTKLDLARYYCLVAEGCLVGVRDRPMVLKRFLEGADQDFFYQQRAPDKIPDYVRTCRMHFPNGRSADQVVCANRPALIWVINRGCIDLNPWPVRSNDTDHSDELRLELEPASQSEFATVRQVALTAKGVLEEHGLVGFPRTSGTGGMQINVRIYTRWTYYEVRRAALALAREIVRRAPQLATSAWWAEERQGIFVNYNQNARDRTAAAAYSIRPTRDAQVSTPLNWAEVPLVDPASFTIDTVPARLARIGDPGADIDNHPGNLASLLELSHQDESGQLGGLPWPAHFPKEDGDPRRVKPVRTRRA